MKCLTHCLSKLLNCCTYNNSKITYQWEDFPFLSVENLNLKNKKLLDCTCMSSHNSTINELQIFGNSSIDSLLKTINLNFRMIELDLFNSYKSSKPVVSHGRSANNLQVTSSISFEQCCRVISKYAWKCTDLPLFLNLEIVTKNMETLDKINFLIHQYFHERLLVDNKKNLKGYTIDELRNKIIIISTSNHIHSYHTYLQNIPHNSSSLINSRELSRIYPANIIFSNNYDFTEYSSSNFISMNVEYDDEYLKDYLNFFNGVGIKLKKL